MMSLPPHRGKSDLSGNTHWILRKNDLGMLLRALREDGYRLAGPNVLDGAIVCGEIDGLEDLPSGWSDTQTPGRYRLERRQDEALFGYATGPQSWKKYFLPPELRLFSAKREGPGFVILEGESGLGHYGPDMAHQDSGIGHRDADVTNHRTGIVPYDSHMTQRDSEMPSQATRTQRNDPETTRGPLREASRKLALIAVRACEIAALRIQDHILRHGQHPDPHYAARREEAFIVAVNCTAPGGTCFCASMETGPQVEAGFDLALTELLDGGDHRFVVEIGSEAGRALLARAGGRLASETDLAAAVAAVQAAAGKMGRALDTRDIKTLLYDNAEHPRWDEVANRCLACANCTMVCPTCFCTTVEDVTDLSGDNAERLRRWDSCFTSAFSQVHGGSIRASVKARYRQWLTHKVASWIDQFGTSGCVGCGRCITWCPAGIDLTEEVAAIRAAPALSGHRKET